MNFRRTLLCLLFCPALICRAADIPGTVVLSPITLGNDGAVTGITNKHIGDTAEMKGTPKSVTSLLARNAIPAARRAEGMTSYVTTNAVTYQLIGGIDNTNWQAVVTIGGTGTNDPRIVSSPSTLTFANSNLTVIGGGLVIGLTNTPPGGSPWLSLITTQGTAPFVIGVTGTEFDGVFDDILAIGWNVKPGGTQINPNAQSFQLTMESDYFTTDRHYFEWNLDYRGTNDLNGRRIMAFGMDRDNPDYNAFWQFGIKGGNFTVLDSSNRVSLFEVDALKTTTAGDAIIAGKLAIGEATTTTSLSIASLFGVNGGNTVWGIGKAQGLLTFDTGKVMMGGQAGNDLELRAANSTAMKILQNGNVGIGQLLPEYPFQVQSGFASSAGNVLWGQNVGTASPSFEGVLSWDNTTKKVTVGANTPETAVAFILEGNTEIMRISTNGYFGVGTEIPDYLFQVGNGLAASGGNVLWGQNVSAASPANEGVLSWDVGKVTIGANTPSTDVQFVIVGGVPIMTLRTNGNAGIGTTIPTNALQVIGDGHFENTVYASALVATNTIRLAGSEINSWDDVTNYFALPAGSGGIPTLDGKGTNTLFYSTTGTDSLVADFESGFLYAPNPSELRIDFAEGELFIGASERLDWGLRDLYGTWTADALNVTGALGVGGSTITSWNDVRLPGTNTVIAYGNVFRTNSIGISTNGTSITGMVSVVNGNVGIGTVTPLSKLQVEGDLLYAQNNATDADNAFGSPSTVGLAIIDNGAEAITRGGTFGFGGIVSGSKYLFAVDKGGKENNSGGNYAGYRSFWTTASTSENFERMRITSTGNVGIGTTTPTEGRVVIAGGNLAFKNDNTDKIGATGANRPSEVNVGTLVVSPSANIRTNVAQFDVAIADFVIGTRYTNSTRRSFVAASFQLAAAVAGTAAVTFNVEQSGVTNKLTISSGPLTGLTTIEPLTLMVGPGAFYYFADTSSGAGAVASIVAGTSSKTDW